MNIAPPEWTRIHPSANNHLTSALCGAFQVSRPTPADLRALLARLSGRVSLR